MRPMMPEVESSVRELEQHPRRAELGRLVHSALEQARGAGTLALSVPGTELSQGDADTALGNVLDALGGSLVTPQSAQLLSAAWAWHLATEPATVDTAIFMLWADVRIGLHSYDALRSALGPEAGAHTEALKLALSEAALTAAERTVAAAIIGGGRTSGGTSEAARERLDGHVVPPPRHPLWTAVLAVTTLLFFIHAVRLIGRYALGFKRPARVQVTDRGVEFSERTELLGRVIRDREHVMPLAQVVKVSRETRFNRAGLYAGLAALVIGTYFGMGLFVDGVRVGSPAWLAIGFLIMLVGLGVDFALSSLKGAVKGRGRLIVVPRKGRTICVAAVEPRQVDEMLSTVRNRLAPHGA